MLLLCRTKVARYCLVIRRRIFIFHRATGIAYINRVARSPNDEHGQGPCPSDASGEGK